VAVERRSCCSSFNAVRRLRLAAAAVLLLTALAAPALAAAPTLQLEQSVLFMRHGARSPNQTPEQLAPSSTRPWPKWPVAAGELTEHGAALVRDLGGYYRQQYAAAGLLPAKGCPAVGSVAAWADSSARRISLSAQALLDGMFPGCGLKVANASAADPNPFHAGALDACPASPRKAHAAVLSAAGGDVDRAAETVRAGMKRMQAIMQVRFGVNCADNAPSCGLDGMANAVEDGSDGPKLEGGLKLATTIGENFYFEYVQGMPQRDVAWGEAATPEALAPLLGPRNLYLRLLHHKPYLAALDGTPVARAMLAALDDDSAAAPKPARLVAFVGRDIHLASRAGMLGVEWTLQDQPDNNPPGATLAFEVLRNPADGKRYARAVLYYQTLQQMRAGSALDPAHPPSRLVLKIPDCADDAVDGACPLPVLRERLASALAPDCPGAAR
jgi:4-phytase / acid phosphatase